MSDKTPHTPNPPEDSKKDKVSEVRYIPVEYLPQMQDDDDEIDLMELARRIWDGRWTIIKITGVFIAIGLFWALFSPEEYESEAILMPEVQTQQQGRASRLLQQFSGQLGINPGGDLSQGTIPPMIYPRIVNSLSFQLKLLEKELHFRDYNVRTNWPDFLENYNSKPLTAYLKDYTIGLPFTLLAGIRLLFSSNDGAITAQGDQDLLDEQFISISHSKHTLVNNLRERISVNQDNETGLLTTRVKLQDARAAAELNHHLIELLIEYITEYRIGKMQQDLEFVEQQHASAKERFERTQLNLAEFLDRNISLATARAQTEQERLQDEKDLAMNVYNSLSQQLEETRLLVQQQRPVFQVVQAVNVPSQRSEPKRFQILITFTLLGSILAVGFVLLLPILQRFKPTQSE